MPESPRYSASEYACLVFFFSSRRRHTRFKCDWSSDVCSSDLIVVCISPVIEMETAEHAFREEPRDDLLHILRLIMVAGVDQHSRLRSGRAGQMQRHSPICDIRVIEGRLKRLVFDEQLLARQQIAMNSAQSVFEPALPLPDVGAARVVRAIRKPQGNVAGSQGTRDPNTFANMLQCLLADCRIRVAQRAKLIVLIFKEI